MVETPEAELTKALTAGLPAGVRTLYFHAFQSRVFNAFCDEVKARADAGAPLVESGDLLLENGALREARGEPGEERLLAFPLVGYRTVDELSACPRVAARVKALFENHGLDSVKMKQLPAFLSGGQVRLVFTPVEELRAGLVSHQELGEQLLSTPFEPIKEKFETVQVSELDLVREVADEQFWSLVLDFRLGAAAYASEVAGSVLGAPINVERQKEFVDELEKLYGAEE